MIAEIVPIALEVAELLGLQWGRDQLIAEISSSEQSADGTGYFNGAAIN